MKYLAIDYGSKRIGVATSDDGGTMAFPLCVIMNTKTAMDEIVALVHKEHVGAIVVGESNDLSSRPNPIMKDITAFVEILKEKTELPVEYMTEVYTSREAAHIQGDNDQNDSSAAAIILQSYMDKINPKKTNNECE